MSGPRRLNEHNTKSLTLQSLQTTLCHSKTFPRCVQPPSPWWLYPSWHMLTLMGVFIQQLIIREIQKRPIMFHQMPAADLAPFLLLYAFTANILSHIARISMLSLGVYALHNASRFFRYIKREAPLWAPLCSTV